MALTVRVKPRAERQIDSAAAWWSENRLAAPGAIRSDLHAALDALVEQPGIGNLVENARDPETRRLFLPRTHHFVYYRPRGQYLEVVAFWHSGREFGPSVYDLEPSLNFHRAHSFRKSLSSSVFPCTAATAKPN